MIRKREKIERTYNRTYFEEPFVESTCRGRERIQKIGRQPVLTHQSQGRNECADGEDDEDDEPGISNCQATAGGQSQSSHQPQPVGTATEKQKQPVSQGCSGAIVQ